VRADADQAGQETRRLSDLDPRDNAFDSIRLIAALSVIVSHAFPLTGEQQDPLQWLSGGEASIGHMAVCVFFLISGYLIPASLDRGSLARFASKRGLRIMPGLVAAVLICAFILGPLVTTLALPDYLAATGTWKFLGNMVFLPVGFALPGVFESNPTFEVNGSLWSLRYEVACYVMVPLTFAFLRWRLAAVAACWLASLMLAELIDVTRGSIYHHAGLFFTLFRYFGSGMLLYLLADRVPMRASWAWAGCAASVLSVPTPLFGAVTATLGAYALIYFAHHAPSGLRHLTARGDISYGVYVYAFPIQQLLVPLSLSVAASGAVAAWLVNTALALPLAVLAGAASWLWVEKPFMALGRGRTGRPQPA
jgi:peptidoglycan/LPS O-acetylase OafA/YrhL